MAWLIWKLLLSWFITEIAADGKSNYEHSLDEYHSCYYHLYCQHMWAPLQIKVYSQADLHRQRNMPGVSLSDGIIACLQTIDIVDWRYHRLIFIACLLNSHGVALYPSNLCHIDCCYLTSRSLPAPPCWVCFFLVPFATNRPAPIVIVLFCACSYAACALLFSINNLLPGLPSCWNIVVSHPPTVRFWWIWYGL